MIFGERLLPKVLNGWKTVTRRVVVDGQPCRYVVGRSYAVQPGRRKRAVARIEVVSVRQERVGDIDYVDARREGFKDRAEFFDYWRELHGNYLGQIDENCKVWRIEFKLANEGAAE